MSDLLGSIDPLKVDVHTYALAQEMLMYTEFNPVRPRQRDK